MELSYLRVFYEVAKVGRFTEAAKRLNISQSALSRSVALLEEGQGVKLFNRSKHGVELTPVGIEVFNHCTELFKTAKRIEDVCRGIQDTCEGPLHFATSDHVTNYLLTAPLTAFRREYPAVHPRIVLGTPDDIIHALLNTECEFGLMFAKVTIPGVNYEAIREEPMALVVSSEVWKQNRGASHAATLNKVLDQHGYISSIAANQQSRPSRVLMELFGRLPPIGIEVSGQEAQKRFCLAGGGVAYLSRFMVASEIERGLLHEVEVESPHVFKLWAATQKGRTISRPARVFLDYLRTNT